MSQFPFSVPPRAPAEQPPADTLQRLGGFGDELMQAQENGNLPMAIATLATMAAPGCCTVLLATAPKGFSLAKPGDASQALPSRFITAQDMAKSLRILLESLAARDWKPSKENTVYLGFHLPDAGALPEAKHLEYLGRGCYGYRLPDIVVEHFHRKAVADLQHFMNATQHGAAEEQAAAAEQPVEAQVPQG